MDELKKQLKKKKEKAAADITSMAAIADFVIAQVEGGRLVAGDAVSKDIPVYKISDENVLTAMTELDLTLLVNLHFANLKSRDRKEVTDFIRLKLAQTAKLDMSTVQPVAFADELTQLTWNRLPLKRSDLANVSLDELPEFAHFLKFCNDPRALVLWLGSLLDPSSARSQYLHLHGKGGNGKSRLFEGVESVLGDRFVVRTRSDMFAGGHWGEEVEGKRLLLFAEDNNPGFFGSSKFKEFTGEAVTTVNPKYQKARQIRLTHKTVVISNNQVEISSSTADRRRLVSISVEADPDSNHRHTWWYKGLYDSASKILAYCLKEYEQAVAADPTVRASVPQDDEVIEAAVARKYSEMTDTILKHYTVTKDYADRVDRSEVHATLSEAFGERRTNRIFLQQLKEALGRLGAESGDRQGGIGVYRFLRAGGVKDDGRESVADKARRQQL